jgi:hypothetical protein
MTYGPNFGLSNYLDIEFLIPKELDELQEWIANRERLTADIMNIKEMGNYDKIEFVNGQQWFTTANNQVKRYAFRKVFEGGAIAAGATDTFAHGIGTITTFTRIYGTAITDVVDYRPIPFAHAATVTDQISIVCTATQISVTNGATAPGITSYIVVVEYLKN